MSLYDDIEIDSSTSTKEGDSARKATPSGFSSGTESTSSTPLSVNKMNLSFLKSQLEAKKAILQNAASQNKAAATASASQPPPPVLLAQPPLLAKQQQKFKLKPHKAMPLPVDSSGAFSLVPKSLKEDKVFLFGELMIEDEYNPTAPTDYASFKQKREAQRLKEKIAKDIADRLAKEAAEEEEKRKKGAAIAPPTALVEPHQGQSVNEPPEAKEEPMEVHFEQPKLPHFGKGTSRGLGVAHSIMSKMGYKQGSGLGAKEQGISKPLEVQRTGRIAGLIVAEESVTSVVTSLEELGGQGGADQQNG